MIGTGFCHVDRKLGHLQFSLSVSEVLHAVSWWRRSGGRTLVLLVFVVRLTEICVSTSRASLEDSVSKLRGVDSFSCSSGNIWSINNCARMSTRSLTWTCLRPLCILSSVAPLMQSRYRTAYTERGVSRMECRNVLNPRELASKSSFGPWLWIPLPSYTVQCYILKGRNLDCFPSYNLL